MIHQFHIGSDRFVI